MQKKGVRVIVTGKLRPTIDVDAMAAIIIALGREFAQRKQDKPGPTQAEAASA